MPPTPPTPAVPPLPPVPEVPEELSPQPLAVMRRATKRGRDKLSEVFIF
jgi:hypothetical protein